MMDRWQARLCCDILFALLLAICCQGSLACVDLISNSEVRSAQAPPPVINNVNDLNNYVKNGAAVVHTPQELKSSLEDSSVTCILVAEDIALRWYNGWDSGSVFSGSAVFRSTNVTLASVPGAEKRAEIDVGGMQLLGSVIILEQITLTLSRLYLKNVMPVQRAALEQDLAGSHIIVSDSIVHLKATSELLSDVLVQSPGRGAHSDTKGSVAYSAGSCALGDTTVDCPDGGVYIEHFSEAVGWMPNQHNSGMLQFSSTLFAFEQHQFRYVASAMELGKYLEESYTEDLFVNPASKVLDMDEAASCSKADLRIALNHDVMINGRSGEISTTFFDFKQKRDCMTIGKGAFLHLRDIVVDDCAKQGEFRKHLLPFFKMEHGSTILLEAVVVAVEPISRSTGLGAIEHELRSAFVDGGSVNITRMSLGQFFHKSRFIKAMFKNAEANGLLVTNATLAEGEGAKIKVLHSFFIIDDSLYPSGPSGGHVLVAFGFVLACLLLGSVAGVSIIRYKVRDKQFCSRDWQQPLLSTPKKSLVGKTKVDEELAVLSQSPGDVGVHQDHQRVAEKLLESLTLGNLIGRGGFGQVYKATWNGAVVAVKVIFHRENLSSADDDAAREASLSADLRHPNVVQTFMQATRVVTETSDKGSSTQSTSAADHAYIGIQELNGSSTSSSSIHGADQSVCSAAAIQHKETWLVQEHCDLGSLGHSLKLKLLTRGVTVDMEAVLMTCADIARGMEYLHSRNVIHGDLKCTNVLLCSSVQDPRGFVAKVADFGLSRQMAVNVTHISTNTVGTLTHMPPELLKGRKLCPKGDVYSFGIMLWELVMGKSPFEGWTAPQLLRAVLNEKWRPTFPGFTPHGFNELGSQCLREEPEERPSFCEILRRLEDLRKLARS